MTEFNDVQVTARRIRAAVESLTDPDDLRVVRDYLSELELVAAQQEAEDARSRSRGPALMPTYPGPERPMSVARAPLPAVAAHEKGP